MERGIGGDQGRYPDDQEQTGRQYRGHNALASFDLFRYVLGVLVCKASRVSACTQDEPVLLPATVRVDGSLDGWGFDGSPDSSFPDVVLHPAFAIVHIYLVFYHDYIEQRGETSSIIGG